MIRKMVVDDRDIGRIQQMIYSMREKHHGDFYSTSPDGHLSTKLYVETAFPEPDAGEKCIHVSSSWCIFPNAGYRYLIGMRSSGKIKGHCTKQKAGLHVGTEARLSVPTTHTNMIFFLLGAAESNGMHRCNLSL